MREIVAGLQAPQELPDLIELLAPSNREEFIRRQRSWTIDQLKIAYEFIVTNGFKADIAFFKLIFRQESSIYIPGKTSPVNRALLFEEDNKDLKETLSEGESIYFSPEFDNYFISLNLQDQESFYCIALQSGLDDAVSYVEKNQPQCIPQGIPKNILKTLRPLYVKNTFQNIDSHTVKKIYYYLLQQDSINPNMKLREICQDLLKNNSISSFAEGQYDKLLSFTRPRLIHQSFASELSKLIVLRDNGHTLKMFCSYLESENLTEVIDYLTFLYPSLVKEFRNIESQADYLYWLLDIMKVTDFKLDGKINTEIKKLTIKVKGKLDDSVIDQLSQKNFNEQEFARSIVAERDMNNLKNILLYAVLLSNEKAVKIILEKHPEVVTMGERKDENLLFIIAVVNDNPELLSSLVSHYEENGYKNYIDERTKNNRLYVATGPLSTNVNQIESDSKILLLRTGIFSPNTTITRFFNDKINPLNATLQELAAYVGAYNVLVDITSRGSFEKRMNLLLESLNKYDTSTEQRAAINEAFGLDESMKSGKLTSKNIRQIKEKLKINYGEYSLENDVIIACLEELGIKNNWSKGAFHPLDALKSLPESTNQSSSDTLFNVAVRVSRFRNKVIEYILNKPNFIITVEAFSKAIEFGNLTAVKLMLKKERSFEFRVCNLLRSLYSKDTTPEQKKAIEEAFGIEDDWRKDNLTSKDIQDIKKLLEHKYGEDSLRNGSFEFRVRELLWSLDIDVTTPEQKNAIKKAFGIEDGWQAGNVTSKDIQKIKKLLEDKYGEDSLNNDVIIACLKELGKEYSWIEREFYGTFEFRVGELLRSLDSNRTTPEQKDVIKKAFGIEDGSQAGNLTSKDIQKIKKLLENKYREDSPKNDVIIACLKELGKKNSWKEGDFYPLEHQKSQFYPLDHQKILKNDVIIACLKELGKKNSWKEGEFYPLDYQKSQITLLEKCKGDKHPLRVIFRSYQGVNKFEMINLLLENGLEHDKSVYDKLSLPNFTNLLLFFKFNRIEVNLSHEELKLFITATLRWQQEPYFKYLVVVGGCKFYRATLIDAPQDGVEAFISNNHEKYIVSDEVSYEAFISDPKSQNPAKFDLIDYRSVSVSGGFLVKKLADQSIFIVDIGYYESNKAMNLVSAFSLKKIFTEKLRNEILAKDVNLSTNDFADEIKNKPFPIEIWKKIILTLMKSEVSAYSQVFMSLMLTCRFFYSVGELYVKECIKDGLLGGKQDMTMHPKYEFLNKLAESKAKLNDNKSEEQKPENLSHQEAITSERNGKHEDEGRTVTTRGH